MSFLEFAIRNLLRRRLRTLLGLAGVALGVGAFVALVGLSDSFEQQWLRLYQSAGTDIVVIHGTVRPSVDQSLLKVVQEAPGVAESVAVSWNMVDLTPDISALIFGWSVDSFEFEALTVLEGRRFHENEMEMMLGEHLAESLGKRLGDTVDIEGSVFRVVGKYRGGTSFETAGCIMPLAQLQRIFDMGTKVAGFHIRMAPTPANTSTEQWFGRARSHIESRIPGARAMPSADLVRTNPASSLARSLAWSTSMIALIVAMLGIANTMAMSVFERTKEIGILRALGWSPVKIVGLIMLEASALALAGGVCGLLAGAFALRQVSSIKVSAGLLQAAVGPMHFLGALGVSLFVGLIAGLIPSIRAARMPPVEALRHE